MTELYQKYRPQTLEQMVGQPNAVKTIKGLFARNKSVPRALLFTGPTGTGKTTAARIVARMLGVPDRNITEVNCGTCDPLDTVRSMEDTAKFPPLVGPAHVWILNEAQSLSRAGFAQQGLLDPLEYKDGFGFFMFTTTDPSKINDAVKGRCTEIALNRVPGPALALLVKLVAGREKISIDQRVLDAILDGADGSARAALVLLEKHAVGGFDPASVQPGEADDSFEIVKAMRLYGGAPPAWNVFPPLLDKYKDKSAEGIRQMILAAARSALLKNGSMRARTAIDLFRDSYGSAGPAAPALLAADLHRFAHGK